jgi:3-hydroxymyristoyl/3-hydroxydecanoyl-(acyl carrier protein) dehydratase
VFGAAFAPFDRGRFIARLPGPPFLLVSRIVSAQPPPGVLAPDGWIEAEVDLAAEDWYFRADRCGSLPVSILMEIALQPCGWLAAYAGSSLRSEQDLKFRNLGGTARLHRNIPAADTCLTVRARMTQASEAADMILEAFEFRVMQGNDIVYEGTTDFGFFTPAALEQQVGIRESDRIAVSPGADEGAGFAPYSFSDTAPLSPDDPHPGADAARQGLNMPAKALRMVDTVDLYLPHGGPAGIGFVRGTATVDPGAWFFKAHFYQDPVWPGSLGIESFVQLIKFAARRRWPDRVSTHRFALSGAAPHAWRYRGQIVPKHRKVTVTAAVTRVAEDPQPMIEADGWLEVDGRVIYKMENFGLQLVPLDR